MSVRRRPTPSGRRALVLGMVLSLLVPGLGHAYLNHLVRALIWFAGTVAVWLVLQQDRDDRALALSMGAALGVLSAVDVLIVHRIDARSRSRL